MEVTTGTILMETNNKIVDTLSQANRLMLTLHSSDHIATKELFTRDFVNQILKSINSSYTLDNIINFKD